MMVRGAREVFSALRTAPSFLFCWVHICFCGALLSALAQRVLLPAAASHYRADAASTMPVPLWQPALDVMDAFARYLLDGNASEVPGRLWESPSCMFFFFAVSYTLLSSRPTLVWLISGRRQRQNGLDAALRLPLAVTELMWLREHAAMGGGRGLSAREPQVVLQLLAVAVFVEVVTDVQRLFHAIVGVQPLRVPDGMERCPLCHVLWPQSSRVPHLCPRLLSKPDGPRRPGEAFANPDDIGWWSSLTYSWLSPLPAVALHAPNGFFGPPPASASAAPKLGQWRALEAVVARLPAVPPDLRTAEAVDEPAWALWQAAREAPPTSEAAAAPPRTRGPRRAAALIRGWLAHIFIRFFLPPPSPPQQQAAAGPHLFELFLRHPSGREFVYTCVPLKLGQDILSVLAPQLVRALVTYVRETAVAAERRSALPRGVAVVAALLAVLMAQALLFQYYLQHLYVSSLKATSALKTLLLRHTLATPLAYAAERSSGAERQRKIAEGDTTLSLGGEAITLVAVDAPNCGAALIFMHNAWGHPLVILASLLTMCGYVGVLSTLVTFAVLVALIPVNRRSVAQVRRAQQLAKNAGDRLSYLDAALSTMRTVKAMALEDSLLYHITRARRAESDGAVHVIRAESHAAAQTEIITLLISIVCFGTYFATGGSLDAAVLVPTLATLNVIRFPIWSFPTLFAQVSKGFLSMQRIEVFLRRDGRAGPHALTATTAAKAVSAVTPGGIRCAGSDFAWCAPSQGGDVVAASARVLKDVRLDIEPGQFVVVRGATGSGKTALLLAMLKELYPLPRAAEVAAAPFDVGGPVAYCAEVPWLRSATVRENIRALPDSVAESSGERAWYDQVLHACALTADLALLPLGDRSDVGDGGEKLSGGQRARVALARAVYRAPATNIFLLDDILSALDVEVQQHIITHVIHGLLRREGCHKTVVLCTHTAVEQLMPTRVLVVEAGGTVVEDVEWSPPSAADLQALVHDNTAAAAAATSDVTQQNPKPAENDAAPGEEESPPAVTTAVAPPRLSAARWTSFIPFAVQTMGLRWVLAVVASSVLMQVFQTAMDSWLAVWVAQQRGSSPQAQEAQPGGQYALVIAFIASFAAIGCTSAFFSFLRTRLFFLSYQRVADVLQLQVVARLFRAPASFFDNTSSSGLLHVLSSDQDVVDHAIGESVRLIINTTLQLLAMIAINTARHPSFIALVPLSVLLFLRLTTRFLRLTKQVRTLEGKINGHVVHIFKEAVHGAVTERAFAQTQAWPLQQEMQTAIDAAHTAGFVGIVLDRWVGLRLELVSLTMTAAAALLSVGWACFSASAGDHAVAAAAFAGIAIIGCMNASRSLSMLCRRIGTFRNQIVCFEQLAALRCETPTEVGAAAPAVVEYTPPEAGAAAEAPVLLDVRGLSARYQPQLPRVLRDIDFSVRPGECVGMIGRTGNGKSSVFNALLRLMDVVEGSVQVPVWAGAVARLQDTSTLPLQDLRRRVFQLLPQEPFLVQGTCRSNLLLGLEDRALSDAGLQDSRLKEVLRTVFINHAEQPPAAPTTAAGETVASPSPADASPSSSSPAMAALMDLDFVIAAGGSNISAGQRQLLCLARVLLWRPRIVLLDEVSSRVDVSTAAHVEAIVKEELLRRRETAPAAGGSEPQPPKEACGVLLIAHRLESIRRLCDRVLVFEEGSCVSSLTREQVATMDDLQLYL